jgi:hypothetical protein
MPANSADASTVSQPIRWNVCDKSATSVGNQSLERSLTNGFRLSIPAPNAPFEQFTYVPSLNFLGPLVMSKLGFSLSVFVTAAVISVCGCFGAVSEAAAPSGKKVAAVLEPSARPRASVTHVYLMRGFLNVFSLGMDTLATELRSAGISATVDSYVGWHEVAHAIAANYRAGQRGPIVLVGHSFGADSVRTSAKRACRLP